MAFTQDQTISHLGRLDMDKKFGFEDSTPIGKSLGVSATPKQSLSKTINKNGSMSYANKLQTINTG